MSDKLHLFEISNGLYTDRLNPAVDVSKIETVTRHFERECPECGGAGVIDEMITTDCTNCYCSGKVPCPVYRVRDGVLEYRNETIIDQTQWSQREDLTAGYSRIIKWLPVPEPVLCGFQFQHGYCYSGHLLEGEVGREKDIGLCQECGGSGLDPDWQKEFGDVWEAWEQRIREHKEASSFGDDSLMSDCELVLVEWLDEDRFEGQPERGISLVPPTMSIKWLGPDYSLEDDFKPLFDYFPELTSLTLQRPGGEVVVVERSRL